MDAWPLVFIHEPGLQLVVNARWETLHEANARTMKEIVEINREIRRKQQEENLIKKNRNNVRYKEPAYRGRATIPAATEETFSGADWQPLVKVEFGGANYVLTPAQMKYLQDHGVTGFRYP